jgi:hypothetical protein
MHVSIRRYGVDPSDMDEIAERVRSGFVPLVSQIPGFVSYKVLDSKDGTLASISVFETVEAARQSDEIAKTWVQENLVGLFSGIPDVIAGEVVVCEPE